MSIKEEDQVFQSNGADWKAFMATPESPKGVVIVIHEIWGLNDDIRRIARDFAAAGYAAIAPDLYSNAEPVTELSSEVFARVFGEPFSSQSLNALHDLQVWLGEKGWKKEKTVAVGFCFGGTYAVRSLITNNDTVSAVSFYGQAPEENVVQKLKKPVLCFYGEDDQNFDEQRDKMMEYSKRGLPIEVKVYSGAAHSFMNKHREGTYRPEVAKDAWRMTLDFISRELKD